MALIARKTRGRCAAVPVQFPLGDLPRDDTQRRQLVIPQAPTWIDPVGCHSPWSVDELDAEIERAADGVGASDLAIIGQPDAPLLDPGCSVPQGRKYARAALGALEEPLRSPDRCSHAGGHIVPPPRPASTQLWTLASSTAARRLP